MINNKTIRKVTGLLLCVFALLVTAFTVSYLFSLSQKYFVSDNELFYSAKEDPQVGETITLYGLKDKNGQPFDANERKEFILLSIVDSDCGACKVARDQINWIQKGIKESEVEYIFVSFTSKMPFDKFLDYTQNHYQSTNLFLWKDNSSPSPKSLSTTVVPSHILIDSDGKILKTFLGTHKDRSTRKKMADYIIKEVKETAK